MKQRDYFRLNEGEEIIGGSDTKSMVFDRGGFLLTNHRVFKVDRSAFGGDSKVHTFNLENLDSIQTTASLPWVFLLLAAGSLGLMAADKDLVIFGGILFIGFVIAFFLRRRKCIRLASGRSEMILNVTAMAHKQIQELVFEVEQAKQARLDALQKNNKRSNISSGTADTLPAGDPKQRLSQIQALLDDGFITKEEFEKKRSQILEEL